MQTDDVTVIPLALITRQIDERTEGDKATRMTRGGKVS